MRKLLRYWWCALREHPYPKTRGKANITGEIWWTCSNCKVQKLSYVGQPIPFPPPKGDA